MPRGRWPAKSFDSTRQERRVNAPGNARMASQHGLELEYQDTMHVHPLPKPIARLLSRRARIAISSVQGGRPPVMDLDTLSGVPLATIDGSSRTERIRPSRRTVLMLIDAYRTRADRSAAEIAWVHERIASDVDLVVVWPAGARDQALAIRNVNHTSMYLDTTGDFRRLVSPTGKRTAILVDPELGTIERLTRESALFAVGHVDERGGDHTLDLGDVYR